MLGILAGRGVYTLSYNHLLAHFPHPRRGGRVSAALRAAGAGRAGASRADRGTVFRTSTGPRSLSSISQESRAATGCSGEPPKPAAFLPNGHSATASSHRPRVLPDRAGADRRFWTP